MTMAARKATAGLASIVLGGLLLTSVSAANPSSEQRHFHPEVHTQAADLVEELSERGLSREWLTATLNKAEFTQGVLDAMAGAAERRLGWHEYRAIFLIPERIDAGVAFIDSHTDAMSRAQTDYGVPAEIIAAIIGVETYYGRHTGRHRVLDSLATLAFHHPVRGGFFRGELSAFLELTHEQGVAPESLKGSYAGAMGYPQFIPTSYQAYAVDFDDDGLRDLWRNPVDAIGSVANYFSEHGWQPGAPVYHEANGPENLVEGIEFNQTSRPYVTLEALRAAGIEPAAAQGDAPRIMKADQKVIPLALEMADESYRYRLAHDNFYVITRYNHSHLYAMAVTELSEAIAEQRGETP
ncbi:lytic murein transglycosylase B [Vreelandella zhuhanensis]